MSSQAQEKKCCVCGAPSTMRCSACSQAGIDLYFCSTEHQKLVWFAHKPMCGPLKASFHVLPDLTPSETRILQSPSFLQTLPQRRAPGTSSFSVTIGEAIDRLERDTHLIPGTFLRNVPRMSEWLHSLASQPDVCFGLRTVINSGLSAFVYSQDNTEDPLEMPAHAVGLDLFVWLCVTHRDMPRPKLYRFSHGATIWAGLLRILAGRVTVAGVDSSFVTPEFVRSNLERLLRSIQADLDLAIDVTGGGLLTLVSQPLNHVPAMFGYNIQISSVAGDPARNMISIGRPGDASHAERFAQTVRERFFPNAT
ncbi:hypothetical protein JCM8115_006291 [Rhodotorula mucilaginosa]